MALALQELAGLCEGLAAEVMTMAAEHTAAVCALLGLALVTCVLLLRRPTPRALVLDFSVFAPPVEWRFPRHLLRGAAEKNGRMLPEHIDFCEKLLYRTGLGDETAVPLSIKYAREEECNIAGSRQEFADTCFSTVEALLAKTGVAPRDIAFVVTNSSLFNPTPSLSAMIMNRFKMGKRTRGYSLGGMGCSAGVIAIDLARDLLQVHPNCLVLVVSHENISNSYYTGKDPSMLLPNSLFRANGAAILLSNRARDAGRAKYVVSTIVRTNSASDDVAFNCVQQLADDEGNVGVRLTKDIVQVGTRALTDNMTALGPVVLPLNEKLMFAANFVTRKLAKSVPGLKASLPASWTKPYIPNFKSAFEHFCIHTGGRSIIDGLEKELQLSRRQVEPSRASLYRFGNTSSTSVWYELAYTESKQGVARGDRVWQLAFGSGFKFNSAVLVANRRVREVHKAWEGFDSEAMWVDLDALEAAARSGRAAKAARLAAEAEAANVKGAAAGEAPAGDDLQAADRDQERITRRRAARA